MIYKQQELVESRVQFKTMIAVFSQSVDQQRAVRKRLAMTTDALQQAAVSQGVKLPLMRPRMSTGEF